MDSEHRHELKTNELADWIAHFPDWCRRNARTLIGVGLIAAAAVVFLWGRHIRGEASYRRQAEAVSLIEQFDISKLRVVGSLQQDVDTGDAIMIAANRLQMAVDESKSPHTAALLLIKHGEALRSDLHYRPAELDEEIIEQRIKEARQAYERALPLAKGNSTLVAMARFGLGLCAEEIGDYIRAEEIYKSIIGEGEFRATVFPAQARQRLDNMEENRRQFVFVDAPALPEPDTRTMPFIISGGDGDITIGDQQAPAVIIEQPLQVEDTPLPTEGEPTQVADEPQSETPAEEMAEVEGEATSEEADEADEADMNS